ncbi:MAG: MATE family efflux transporter [Clostridia bacterium]|nr:MATE family efflux transporter [Clostridia bacterium]
MAKESIKLSDSFGYKKLLKFTLPSIIMTVFTSIYSVVDGLFVSNFAGKEALAAINIIFPVIMILGAIGFMMGTGGAALVAKTLGEGDRDKANSYFSMIVYVTIGAGIIFSAAGQAVLKPLAAALGAKGDTLTHAVTYARILLCSLTALMLQFVFQAFFIAAEKPKLGLMFTVIAGIANIALDAAFIVGLNLGVAGAAAATAVGQVIGGIGPIIYFAIRNSSLLRLKATKLQIKPIIKACGNGSSEFMTNISMSVVTMLFNFQLMKIAGDNGVAAYSAIAYIQYIFVSIFLGYSTGCSPVISYHFGAQNKDELKGLLKKSLIIIAVFSAMMTAASESLASPLSKLFVGYDYELYLMTRDGLRIAAAMFAVCGFNIFGSAFFTALNNGIVSAAISLMRTLIFQIITVMTLPIAFGLNGVWMSVAIAEVLAVAVTIAFMIAGRKKYGYA